MNNGGAMMSKTTIPNGLHDMNMNDHYRQVKSKFTGVILGCSTYLVQKHCIDQSNWCTSFIVWILRFYEYYQLIVFAIVVFLDATLINDVNQPITKINRHINSPPPPRYFLGVYIYYFILDTNESELLHADQ